eukprot:scaffold7432_cov107-Isochrysis_galbana.AAC.14
MTRTVGGSFGWASSDVPSGACSRAGSSEASTPSLAASTGRRGGAATTPTTNVCCRGSSQRSAGGVATTRRVAPTCSAVGVKEAPCPSCSHTEPGGSPRSSNALPPFRFMCAPPAGGAA